MTELPDVPYAAWDTITELAKLGAHPDELPNAYRLTREIANREGITPERAAEWVMRITAVMPPPRSTGGRS